MNVLIRQILSGILFVPLLVMSFVSWSGSGESDSGTCAYDTGCKDGWVWKPTNIYRTGELSAENIAAGAEKELTGFRNIHNKQDDNKTIS